MYTVRTLYGWQQHTDDKEEAHVIASGRSGSSGDFVVITESGKAMPIACYWQGHRIKLIDYMGDEIAA